MQGVTLRGADNRLLTTATQMEKLSSSRDPAKVRDAAEQFEALLIGQMLRSVRESGQGWLGSGGDGAGNTATEFAEQHMAAVLARQGGLGLASVISKGLVEQSPRS